MGKKNKPKPKKPPQHPTKTPNVSGQHLTSLQQRYIHSGPLPPPEVLSKYNQTVPDAAERIIAMAESQSVHRQGIESKVIESDIKNSRLGLHYGLIIGLTAVIGGTICIICGHEIGGGVIGGTGLTGLVGVFVYGSRSKRKEREERLKTELQTISSR